jgi:GntR family transcriptional repressor for pyruvate dehydrogenase complex
METIEKNSLSNSVVREIINSIKNGDYKPGDKLPTIQELSKIFSVGLSSVREGLQQLQSIGIVDIQHGRGTYVKEKADISTLSRNIEHLLILQKPYISHLIEARRLIECETAKRAAKRANKDQIKKLLEILKNMKGNVGEIDIFAVEDVSFHLLIAESTKNPVYGIFLRSIQGLLTEEVKAVLELKGAYERAINYHESIYLAIRDRDSERASKNMYNHIADVEKAINKELKTI